MGEGELWAMVTRGAETVDGARKARETGATVWTGATGATATSSG